MIKSQLLWKGKFNIDKNNITILDEIASTRKTTPEIEKRSAELWMLKQHEAVEQGRLLWDAVTYRIEDYVITDSLLFLTMSTISYKDLTVLKEFDIESLGDNYYPKAGFVSTMLRTSDNKYIIGETRKGIQKKPQYDLIGGVMSKSEGVINTKESFLHALFKEIKEEVNIDRQQLQNIYLAQIVLSQWGRIGFVFNAEVNTSAKNIQDQFNKNNDGELKSLKFVDQNRINESLNEMGGYRVHLLI